MSSFIILSACTPREQEFRDVTGGDPVISASAFRSSDEAELASHRWLPHGKPKAVIIALHGMNDYSHAFEGVGHYFSSHGVAVYAYDQRGFGQSPDVGIWGGRDNFVHDLKSYVNLLKERYPKTPVYVLGESMGGAVAIVALTDPGFPKVDGVILSAPAVWGEETIPLLYRGTLWTAAHTIPYKTFSGSNLRIVASDNYDMLVTLSKDPLVIKHTRVDAIYGMVHLMDEAYEKVPALHAPTLLLYGANDQVIPPAAIEHARARFSMPVHYVYYPDGYHLLLRDMESETVMRDILSWINHPNRALPSGYGEESRVSADSPGL